MAVLVNAHLLTKSFSSRPLFRDITFSIDTGDRIGLIGPNGAGKSTLLKILAGKILVDEGKLSLQRGLKVGYLAQDPTFTAGKNIFYTVLEGTPDPDEWENQAKAHEYISRFKLDSFPDETLVDDLSGGWKKRVALARELIREPDILLLDEPTNHLDVESILWLEDLISNATFATLTITHDRVFLQKVSNRILELDPRHPDGLFAVRGDYATFLDASEQRVAGQNRREEILKNTLRRETEWLRQGAKARTTKQTARINRAGDLKEEVEDLSIRNQTRRAGLDFSNDERNPKRFITAKKLSKSMNGVTLFKDLDLLIAPGKRIGLLGPNGCGKSTLIKVLLGKEQPDSGEVQISDLVNVAYFDQIRETLNPKLTVMKTVAPNGEFVDFRGGRMHVRGYLDRFLFSNQQMEMTVEKLSGGEQSRLLLAKLMLTPANLLVLDEPTNDLDMQTLSVLEECLTEFNGALILVTHDRYFLDQVANQILAFSPTGANAGKIESFADLSQWENWHAREMTRTPQSIAAEAAKAKATAEPAAIKSTARKLSYKERLELESMEANIFKAEEKLEKMTAGMNAPDIAKDSIKLQKVAKEVGETQAEVTRLYARWEELAQFRKD